MVRPNIHDQASRWRRKGFIPFIDPYYFLGRNSNEMEGPDRKATPRVNLKKSKELLTLEVAVPGFSREELGITVRDDILTIRGQKLGQHKKGASEYVISEFDTEVMERIFRLAKNIGHEQIQAKYDNGLLRLTFTDVPKKEEKKYQEISVE